LKFGQPDFQQFDEPLHGFTFMLMAGASQIEEN
jgi:hypothetical protein